MWSVGVEVAFVEFQGASGNSENVSLSLSFSEFWAEKMAKIEDRQVFIAEQRQAFAADVAAKQEQTRLADLTPRLWPAVAKYAATDTSARRVAVTRPGALLAPVPRPGECSGCADCYQWQGTFAGASRWPRRNLVAAYGSGKGRPILNFTTCTAN